MTAAQTARSAPLVLTVLAFAAIYFLWGSTFLAIRIAVASVPPLLAAGIRFTLAGSLLYGWARLVGGAAKPSPRQWRNVVILALLLFAFSYSGLFWAEKTIPSGIASVLVATIPVWTALLEIFVLRKEPFHWPLAAGLTIGVAGVAVLAFDTTAGLQVWPCIAIVMAELSWSLGTVLTRALETPKSMLVNSGAQMLVGGLLLLVGSALLGELHPLPRIELRPALAILYLATAGSIVAFTAYVWLLGRMPASIVTSYAFVNPVVALLLGHWLVNEALGLRTLLGAALVLASVLMVVRRPRSA